MAIIEVENISKQYSIGKKESYGSLRDEIMQALAAPFRRLGGGSGSNGEDNTVWALRDVSFKVEEGEVIGVIGKNGAGKSTLLKILSRITEPTTGRIRMKGRVASLLEVGTGFHPELTGRENIFLNGALLGMSNVEIRAKFDEIVAFSEIEKFLDTPVKRYSSGMYVRLAFAVAAHLEPEILIVDEVLAVGDAAFQKKCLGKMGDVAKGGRTVLFVSHNMAAVSSLCKKAVFLRDGVVVNNGMTEHVIDEYLSLGEKTQQGEVSFSDTNFEKTPFNLRSMRTMDKDGRIRSEFTNFEPIIVEIEFSLLERLPYLKVGLEVKTPVESVVFTSFHNDVNEVLSYRDDTSHRYRLRAVIPEKLLNNGLYYIDPLAGVHRQKWLVKDKRGLSVSVVFCISNPEYVGSKRSGCVAPALDWSEINE